MRNRWSVMTSSPFDPTARVRVMIFVPVLTDPDVPRRAASFCWRDASCARRVLMREARASAEVALAGGREVAVATSALSAARVCGPTPPSGGMPFVRWNAATASCVADP